MKRLAIYVLVVLGTLGLLGVLWQFRREMLMFLLSLALAAAFRPPVEYLVARGWRRGFALAAVYLSVVGLIVFLIAVANGPLLKQFELALNNLTRGYETIKTTWPESHSIFQQTIAERLPPQQELFALLAEQQSPKLWIALLGVTTNVMEFVSRLVVILVLSIYWSADRLRFEQLIVSFAPVVKRARLRQAWEAIDHELGGYIRSKVIQAVLAGVVLYSGFRLIGLSYPALLALAGALAWLIPWFGPLITLIPAIWAGLNINSAVAVLAAGWVLVTLVVMRRLAAPRLFQGKEYSSLLMVLVALMLADAFGLFGLILAPLAAATIQIAFNEIGPLSKPVQGWQKNRIPEFSSPGDVRVEQRKAIEKYASEWRRGELADQDAMRQEAEMGDLEVLESRLREIHKIAEEKAEQLTPEMANLLGRLEVLAANARLFLEN